MSTSQESIRSEMGLGQASSVALYTGLALAFLAIVICVELRRRSSASPLRLDLSASETWSQTPTPVLYDLFTTANPGLPHSPVDSECSCDWWRVQPLSLQPVASLSLSGPPTRTTSSVSGEKAPESISTKRQGHAPSHQVCVLIAMPGVAEANLPATHGHDVDFSIGVANAFVVVEAVFIR
ncbi:hypothetical protein HMN09_00871100 [Mycena chlorophos]|uniref:Uncharacterized protein n=1 Tax=Mycena chlorophos TaxID=658473 RepID=A0A8H6SMA2_MYCCL|nr:hypothetical protein HMN09_00871100 [Mycena chlorophos]